jgi:hypothetical protein
MDKETKQAQTKRVFDHWHLHPSTMKECSVATGVMRENICRYVKGLRESKKVYLIDKRKCTITKHRAGIYTTNPDLVDIYTLQISLFNI